MSATDSEEARKSGRLHLGISGRVPSEWVADLRRNQWPAWVGIRISVLNVGFRFNLLMIRSPFFRAHIPRRNDPNPSLANGEHEKNLSFGVGLPQYAIALWAAVPTHRGRR